MPLVSVIILAYQQPDYLNAALASVARQTHRDLEILVVDDASGPECTARYQLPSRARLIINPQRIALAAVSRNAAWRHAAGEFIAFLDQDDLWEPDKLETQLSALHANPSAVMHRTHCRDINAKGIALPRQRPFRPLGRDPLATLLRRNTIAYSSALVGQKALHAAAGFDEAIRGAADWDLWLRLAAAGPVLEDPRPLTQRRLHDAQWSKSMLMMARGCEMVFAKAAAWVPRIRPDLRGLANRRHARWCRELARAQLDLGEAAASSRKLLQQALRTRPWDFRAYALMMRSLGADPARRTQTP